MLPYKQNIKNTLKYFLELLSVKFGHHRRNIDEPRLWIMMYHRILPKSDPRYAQEEPGMIVEPDTFIMHLETLEKEFTIMHLSEWLSKKALNEPLPKKTCAITFDDGWLDNYQYAFPILKKKSIPATLFVVTEMAGKQTNFWPNRISNLLQQPRARLKSIPWLIKHMPKGTINKEIVASIIQKLKSYSDLKILELIDSAEKLLDINYSDKMSLMNWQQIRDSSESGLIEIGSHTCNHIRLKNGLDEDIYIREISQSKKQIEEKINKPVSLFCYPNGDLCSAALSEVSKSYKAAVTTKKGINLASNSLNLYELTRIPVHQDVSDTPRRLLSRIANWP